MAYISQVATTTTANTNLNTTAVLVCTYTNTTRIRKLWVNIFADQVKGGGDYIANIRVQRAGVGSEYVSIKTTLTAAAALTSIYFGSIPITLNATDVMKVYLLGLSTDNDGTADVIVDVNEEWQNIDANGRVDLGAILGAAITGTAAQIVAAFTKWFNVATPTGTINSIPDAVAGAASGLALVGSVMGKSAATLAAGDVSGNLPVANSAGVTTILADYARRTGDYSTYAGGDTAGVTEILTRVPDATAGATGGLAIVGSQVDLVNAPNATALNAAADALLDRTSGIETSFTLRQAMRLVLAALVGKLSGAATTTVTIRDVNDTANRIVATVDSDGNRSSVTKVVS